MFDLPDAEGGTQSFMRAGKVLYQLGNLLDPA